MILVATPGALVSLLVCSGGATPAIVPIAAESGTSGGDEPPLVALATPGFGAVPEGFRSTLPGVVGLCGEA